MNPQNRKSLAMTDEQLHQFSSLLWLIWRAKKKFFWRCPDQHKDDLLNQCRIALARSVLAFTPDKGIELGAYCWLNVRDEARGFLYGRRQFGNAATRDAASHLSLEDVISRENGEERTRLDRYEQKQADKQYQKGCADRHQESVLYLVDDALRRLPPRQREVLELRFYEGLKRPEIAKRLGLSVPRISIAQRAGVRALRSALADRGLKTLPPDAPIPNDGGFARGSRH